MLMFVAARCLQALLVVSPRPGATSCLPEPLESLHGEVCFKEWDLGTSPWAPRQIDTNRVVLGHLLFEAIFLVCFSRSLPLPLRFEGLKSDPQLLR